MLSNKRREEISFSLLQRFFETILPKPTLLLLYLMAVLQRQKYRPQHNFARHLRKSLRFHVLSRDTLVPTPKGVLMVSLYNQCFLFIIFTIISRLFNSFSILVITLEPNHDNKPKQINNTLSKN